MWRRRGARTLFVLAAAYAAGDGDRRLGPDLGALERGAARTLSKGLDVQWAVAVCRTLTGISCPFEGEEVPTVIDLEVETVVQGLPAAGVQRILWVDLHEALPPFAAMNQALCDAALRHPQLTVIDWSGYARGHPS